MPRLPDLSPAADINPNMLLSNVSDVGIDELRLRRRACRTGDIEEAHRLRQVAGQIRDETPEDAPRDGDDTCPACRSERVSVDETKCPISAGGCWPALARRRRGRR
ncbi:hypothetical protein GONAM_15_01180 [Gordonia namibiensis NBRC 108229]|uniref:Uncharacterized protein n=1 Tax=Gordonia namibiensis NBRC 108229 TaxID=1208314 RepID=K6VW16_9ACTN|nr:hypothetical protein GONAM_15_01180 [Gordonia namibiensis NBRC 108229]